MLPSHFTRRDFLARLSRQGYGAVGLSIVSCLPGSVGCVPSKTQGGLPLPDLVIGQRGMADGRFQKPRAMAINSQDQIVVVDKTGRVQVFDDTGKFVRGWRTPEIENGKPTGVSFDTDGKIMVADTHYYRFLFYSLDGELHTNQTIGGTNGPEPGQFAFVTDIVRAKSGEYYCGEYGEFDRLYRYSPQGTYIDRMGQHGNGPLEFSRPQSLVVDQQGLLWVADSCNHRIQVIDWREDKPRLVDMFCEQGTQPGQLQYPYGIAFDLEGNLIVSEFGNHRVQLLDRQGKPLASWGRPGNAPGELEQPWAASVDSQGRVYVVDSGNNRIQRFRF